MTSGGAFETVIQQMLSSDNETRQAAEAIFEESKKSPDDLVVNLVQGMRASPQQEHKHLCAVMLRRVSIISIWNFLKVGLDWCASMQPPT
jgi:hypothetical protein